MQYGLYYTYYIKRAITPARSNQQNISVLKTEATTEIAKLTISLNNFN